MKVSVMCRECFRNIWIEKEIWDVMDTNSRWCCAECRDGMLRSYQSIEGFIHEQFEHHNKRFWHEAIDEYPDSRLIDRIVSVKWHMMTMLN
jgi:hypothetical protein